MEAFRSDWPEIATCRKGKLLASRSWRQREAAPSWSWTFCPLGVMLVVG